MLLGPQTYPMMRELGGQDVAFAGAVAGGGNQAAETARPARTADMEPDFMVMAMMTPCCGLGVWPEIPVRGGEDPLRETALQIAGATRSAWRQAAPAANLVARSGVFLAALTLLATFGVGILHLLGS